MECSDTKNEVAENCEMSERSIARTGCKCSTNGIKIDQQEVSMPLTERREAKLLKIKKPGESTEQPHIPDEPNKGPFWGGLLEDIKIGCPSEGSLENQSWAGHEPEPARRKTTKKQLQDHLCFLDDKYFDLVWYSRSGSWDNLSESQLATIYKKRAEVEAAYPRETAALVSKNGDWECGFDNGMLAGIRYVVTAMSCGLEWAAYEFPFLDT
jgi:hypothetical protein